ncbi:mpv17/PMP22 family domain-containing protein [Rhizoctonia solani AG-1 IA]|uniref:Mpv17/PMP22 family domain-containing protein n=1 Tax=Thanatephorus cucumeris (strain AG1-IA) TaxID=983506 RepID=L8WU76_THACA|nr:mpv17/PMP22 family domain-containing protein [Rhizoctonia solani AG-1 IA]
MATTKPAVHPLLAAYLQQLSTRPLTTKAVTSGILSFLQEILASHIARVPSSLPPKNAPTYSRALAAAKIDARALKLAIYGFFISAPMNHFFVGLLQRAFAGRTGTGAKIAQIVASNLIVAPIQCAVYLASMAIVNGAKTTEEIIKTVKGGFTKLQWITSPIVMVIAQKFIAPELWVPFFNMIQFMMGTFFNTQIKKAKLRQERAAQARKDLENSKKA